MKPVTAMVPLDRSRAISWSNRARYRLGTLAQPPQFTHLNDAARAYTALCAYLWAMLADRPEDFITPEALAEHVDPEKLGDYIKAIGETLGVGADSPKNALGSTQSPSPASSSA